MDAAAVVAQVLPKTHWPKTHCSTARLGIESKEKFTRAQIESPAQADAAKSTGTSPSTIRLSAIAAMIPDTGLDTQDPVAHGLFNSHSFGGLPTAQVARRARAQAARASVTVV